MFQWHTDTDGQWIEFECPKCHCDMDIEASDASDPGADFECPYCNVRLTVLYRESADRLDPK
jgi:hypothetical protein